MERENKIVYLCLIYDKRDDRNRTPVLEIYRDGSYKFAKGISERDKTILEELKRYEESGIDHAPAFEGGVFPSCEEDAKAFRTLESFSLSPRWFGNSRSGSPDPDQPYARRISPKMRMTAKTAEELQSLYHIDFEIRYYGDRKPWATWNELYPDDVR